MALAVTSSLEVVHNAPLLHRIGRFFAVAAETERAELAALVSHVLEDAEKEAEKRKLAEEEKHLAKATR